MTQEKKDSRVNLRLTWTTRKELRMWCMKQGLSMQDGLEKLILDTLQIAPAAPSRSVPSAHTSAHTMAVWEEDPLVHGPLTTDQFEVPDTWVDGGGKQTLAWYRDRLEDTQGIDFWPPLVTDAKLQ